MAKLNPNIHFYPPYKRDQHTLQVITDIDESEETIYYDEIIIYDGGTVEGYGYTSKNT